MTKHYRAANCGDLIAPSGMSILKSKHVPTEDLSTRHCNRSHHLFDGPNPITEVWECVSQRRSTNVAMKDVNRLVELAVSFGFDDLLMLVERNNGLTTFQSSHREFLLDTLSFVATGQRKMSVHTWITYLGMQHRHDESGTWNCIYDIPHGGIIKAEDDMSEYLKTYSDLKSCVHRWLTQSDGFNDMLCSLRILLTSDYTLADSA